MCNKSDGVKWKLSHLIKSLKINLPIQYKLNEAINQIEWMKIRSIIGIAFIFVSNSIMWYYTYVESFLAKEDELVSSLLLFSYVNVCMCRLWVSLIWGLYHNKTTIKLWNKILKLDEYKTYGLRCHSYRKIVTALMMIPSLWIVIYDAVYFKYVLKFKGYPEKYFGFLTILSDYITSLNFINYVTLMLMYANYFKQINDKLNALINNKNNSMNRLKVMREIMKIHEHFYGFVTDTLRIFSPYIIIMLNEYVLLIMRSFLEIVFSLGNNYLNVLLHVFVLLGVILRIGLIIIPSESCMYHANKIRQNLITHCNRSKDKDLLRLMNVFTLQLCHYKLEISAAGLIPLTLSTTFDLLCLLTTPLIFFIQFKL